MLFFAYERLAICGFSQFFRHGWRWEGLGWTMLLFPLLCPTGTYYILWAGCESWTDSFSHAFMIFRCLWSSSICYISWVWSGWDWIDALPYLRTYYTPSIPSLFVYYIFCGYHIPHSLYAVLRTTFRSSLRGLYYISIIIRRGCIGLYGEDCRFSRTTFLPWSYCLLQFHPAVTWYYILMQLPHTTFSSCSYYILHFLHAVPYTTFCVFGKRWLGMQGIIRLLLSYYISVFTW